MKKETVYTMPYEGEDDRERVRELRSELYETHNRVDVCPNGLYEVRVIATNE